MMRTQAARIGTFVAASVVVVFAAAAAEDQTVVTGGAKGGITFATVPAIANEAEVNTGYRPGVLAGGFLAVEFGGQYAFQPEFLYAMKGIHIHPSDQSGTSALELSYFEVPLLFRVSPKTKGRVGFDLFVGPALSFRLSAKATSEWDTGSVSEDVKEDLKSTDVGLVVGGGVHIGKVSIEARWTEGLTNALSHPVEGESEIKNRAFSILVGYKFR
jgi:hypothetical protein